MTTALEILETEQTADVWADDILDRKGLAEKYTNILESLSGSHVIALNSRYGTGKTFFLKRWQQYLPEGKFVSFYYSAWDVDFHEHAFIPFVNEFLEILPKKNIEISDKIVAAARGIVKYVTATMVKGYIQPYLPEGVTSEGLINAVGCEMTNLSSDDFQERYQERKKYYGDFIKCLGEIANTLKKDDKKLVIFIDELERCRPNHAVELLESIKHLFNVDGIIFVLGTDREQLKHTVSNLYGQDMDSDGYLRRFFDLELTLSTPNSQQYVEYLFKLYDLDEVILEKENFLRGSKDLCDYLSFYAKCFNFGLRDIERCFSALNIAIRSLSKGQSFYPILITFLVCLKMKDETLYYQIAQKITIDQSLSKSCDLLSSPLLTTEELRKIQIFRAFLTMALDNREGTFLEDRLNKATQGIEDKLNPQNRRQHQREYRLYEQCINIHKDYHFGYREESILAYLKNLLSS